MTSIPVNGDYNAYLNNTSSEHTDALFQCEAK